VIFALLLAAAPQTAVEAERAFAADAQTLGQWTAFRKWAAPGAIMFVPQPVNAHEFLKNLPDPKLTYQWWPAQAFISCDGKTAVTTGPAVRGAYRGYFTTLWQRQPDGSWRWLLDHGDALRTVRRAQEVTRVRRASCTKPELALQAFLPEPDQQGAGASSDKTLKWHWTYSAKRNARFVGLGLWTGAGYEPVVMDRVADPE
jgi:hypothetical protein